ncbi:MAG: FadR family transcriptional regulator [Planctomycetes bacterium]|nr:FadR family transcriptional regulator [Planctomycetota bacterium]
MKTLAPSRLLSDSIVIKIKNFIAKKRLKTGDRLPTEDELARTFGVSRISLREATKPLRYLGILDSAPRRGLTVGDLRFERLKECLDFHFLVKSYPREQLLRTRIVLETSVLPQVIQQMIRDPELYDRLYALTDLPGITADPAIYLKADIAFHSEIMKASGIEPLIFFDQLLRCFFDRFRKEAAGTSKASLENGIHFHRRIIAALRDGQLTIAHDLVRESFEYYERLV